MFASATWPSYVGRALVVAAGVRAGYLSATWLYGAWAVQRFHVETAWVWFAATLLASFFLDRRRAHRASTDEPSEASPSRNPKVIVVGLTASMVLAVCAYPAVMNVGFFSDDAVLLTRAGGWRLGWVGDQLLRPVPMGIWALVLSAGGGDWMLHLLNVLTHGVNGYLVFRIARGLHVGINPALLAGVLFVLSPLATEPVIWISGYFDVFMTFLCCIAVLIGREYHTRPAHGLRASLWIVVAAAFLTKETAVMVPVLILLDTWARGAWRSSRSLIVDCGILLAAAAVIAVIRLMLPGGEAIREPLSKYMLQTWVFRIFGGAASPMHNELTQSFPLLSVAYTGALAMLLILSGVNTHLLRSITRPALGQLLWMLASAVPLVTFLYVAPDLQGARYLYLASVGWSILIALLTQTIFAGAPRLRPAVAALAGILVLASAGGMHWQQRLWIEAASIRDRVGDAAHSAASVSRCQSVKLLNLPDNHRGVYMFRNGAPEWFHLEYQIDVTTASGPSPCTFYWDGFVMRPVAGESSQRTQWTYEGVIGYVSPS